MSAISSPRTSDGAAVGVGDLHRRAPCRARLGREPGRAGGRGARRRRRGWRRCRRGGSRGAAARRWRRARRTSGRRPRRRRATVTTRPADRGEPRCVAGVERRAASASTVTRRQPAPWTSSKRRPVDGALRRTGLPAWGESASMTPAVDAGQRRHLGRLAGPTAAAMAASRAAASSGSGTQMTLPSSIEKLDGLAGAAAAAPGRRCRAARPALRRRARGRASRRGWRRRGCRRTCPARRTAASGGRRRRRAAPARAPLLGVAGVERVDGVALERGVAGSRRPTARAAPRPRSSSSSSSDSCGEAHELPAAPPGPAGHGGGRPGRVADLQVDRVEHPVARAGRRRR